MHIRWKTQWKAMLVLMLCVVMAAFSGCYSGISAGEEAANETHAEEETTEGSSFESSKYVLYVREDDLYYRNMGMQEPIRLTDSGTQWYQSIDEYHDVKVSLDGRSITYFDDVNGERNLYWRSLTDPDDVIDLGANVTGFYISNDGRYLIWRTMDGKLFHYCTKTRSQEQIAAQVDWFWSSFDGKQVYYEVHTDPDWLVGMDDIPEEYGSHWWCLGKGSEQICSTEYTVGISPDGYTVCYQPRVTLTNHVTYEEAACIYRKRFGEEAVLIADDAQLNGAVFSIENFGITGSYYSLTYDELCYYNQNGQVCMVDQNGKTKVINEVPWFPRKAELAEQNWPEFTYENIVEDTTGGEVGKLYVDGKYVDQDVLLDHLFRIYVPDFCNINGTVMYFKDVVYDRAMIRENVNYKSGTMMLYVNGEVTKVAEDVYDYMWMEDGTILYWCCPVGGTGYSLYYFDGKNSCQLDTNVDRIHYFSYGVGYGSMGFYDMPPSTGLLNYWAARLD